MAGWRHRCNEHELVQTPGDGEGQGGLTCCSPCDHKELHTTGQLNNNKKKTICLLKTVLQVFWIQFLGHCLIIFIIVYKVI